MRCYRINSEFAQTIPDSVSTITRPSLAYEFEKWAGRYYPNWRRIEFDVPERDDIRDALYVVTEDEAGGLDMAFWVAAGVFRLATREEISKLTLVTLAKPKLQ